MDIVTAKEREELFKKWEGSEKVVVTDFASAVKRAEQFYVEYQKEDERKKARLYMQEYRKNPKVREKERQYTYEVLTGQRNIPSAKSTRKFYFSVVNKYGSMEVYNHIRRLERTVKNKDG